MFGFSPEVTQMNRIKNENSSQIIFVRQCLQMLLFLPRIQSYNLASFAINTHTHTHTSSTLHDSNSFLRTKHSYEISEIRWYNAKFSIVTYILINLKSPIHNVLSPCCFWLCFKLKAIEFWRESNYWSTVSTSLSRAHKWIIVHQTSAIPNDALAMHQLYTWKSMCHAEE